MAIDTRNVNNYTNNSLETTKSVDLSKALGQQDFLKLLVTELQNQDPLEPMKDRDFIAQMASFSSLEQMKNLNDSFNKLSSNFTSGLMPTLMMQQSTNLIGKGVDYVYYDPELKQEFILEGAVDSVVIKSGMPYCIINGKEISLENIISVFNLVEEKGTLDDILTTLEKINLNTKPAEEADI